MVITVEGQDFAVTGIHAKCIEQGKFFRRRQPDTMCAVEFYCLNHMATFHLPYAEVLTEVAPWTDPAAARIPNIDDSPEKASKSARYRCNVLRPDEVKEIRQRIAAGKESLSEIGRHFGVTPQLISHIKHGRAWVEA